MSVMIRLLRRERWMFAKTATYALMHIVVAAAVAYAITGSWAAAIAISLVEPLVQTVAYFFHERAWSRFLLERHIRAKAAVAAMR